MEKQYYSLSPSSIRLLESQGCTAESWSKVRFTSPVGTELPIHGVHFSGEILIGSLQGKLPLPGGGMFPCGISHVYLHNVTLGDRCCIDGAGGYIANYDIGNDVLIRQTGTLVTDGPSSFGQGTQVAVLRESGGREVAIHDTLTAQEAHLQALYTDHPEAVRHLKELVKQKCLRLTTDRGFIGTGTVIEGCREIRNVRTGEYARLHHASLLEEGTVDSCEEDPSVIGHDVVARHFVCTTGSCIDSGARLCRCFVGQGTHIGNGFSATDSLFFANCQMENGEACALFAGPFTVSHHKSTLLIGMMTSFMNAGSGSNQSNHAYKLGPLHQGILERGVKTGSSSYLLWPARAGAFSTVLGHHTAHFHTEDFPFSYLMEQEGKTWLVPGAVLHTCGLMRDLQKWPARDKRRSPQRLDLLHYDAFTPYTLMKMQRGIALLERFLQEDKEEIQPGVCMTRQAAEKGIRYYRDQLLITTGHETILQEETVTDLSGCYVYGNALQDLLTELASGTIPTLDLLHERLKQIQYHPSPVPAKESTARSEALLRARAHLLQDAEKEQCHPGLSFDNPTPEREAFIRKMKNVLNGE